MPNQQVKKLYRSTTDKMVMGVCGGLGEYFEIDSTVVRIAWVIMTFITGLIPGFFAYIVIGMIIPQKPQS